jgi:transcriptional regulator with XRE-family HTH domain
MSEASAFWEAVGGRLRECREQRGHRQDDVAALARIAGLPWSRSTIATIEAGRRELSLSEIAALLIVLDMNLPDLFAGLGGLQIAPGAAIDADDLLAGLVGPSPSWRNTAKWTPQRSPLAARAGGAAIKVGVRKLKTRARVWPKAPLQSIFDAEDAAAGETEQKAARRLGVPPIDVSLLAFRLWGRSLTEERDRRVEATATPNAAARTVQALRGHVTRGLLEELRGGLPKRGSRRGKGANK